MAATDVISVGMIDYKGRSGRYVQHIPSGSTDAEIQAYLNAMLEHLDNITGCQLTGVTVTKSFSMAGAIGLKGVPVSSHDFEKGANFGFDVADSDYRYTIRVPGILESTVVGDEADYGNVPISFWGQVVTVGIDPVFPSNRDGLDLLNIFAAPVTFHKSK